MYAPFRLFASASLPRPLCLGLLMLSLACSLVGSSSPALAQSDAAQFISQTAPPTTMVGGHSYAVSVTMKNTGTSTWATGPPQAGSQPTGYALVAQNPGGNKQWNTVPGLSYYNNGVPVPATGAASVAPGQTATFNYTITAPATPGAYNFQWQMLHLYVGFFGDVTTNVPIQVVAPSADDATFVAQTPPPTTLIAGHSYAISVTMKNNGTTTWTTGPPQTGSQPTGYALVAQNPSGTNQWNTIPGLSYFNNGVPVPATGAASVAPGQTATFSYTITAPLTPGTYNFQWQALHLYVAFFGDLTPNLPVQVVAPSADDATFVSQTPPPAALQAGQPYSVSVTMKNTGTTTWTTGPPQAGSQPTGYALVAQNPSGTNQWNTIPGLSYFNNGVPISATGASSVPPGQTATFTFVVNTPTSGPGLFNFQWQMLHLYVGFFGDLTPNAACAVGTDDAAFVSQAPPPSAMVAGRSYPVSVTMQNTGTATWADGTCQILSENPRGNQSLGVSSHPVVGAVAPGQTTTISFNAVTTTPGSYNFQWSLSRSGVHEFGQFSTNVPVTVSAAPTPPTVATPASATPSPVPGKTTVLSVLGADAAGESALTYVWSATGTPPAPVTFSPNSTNAAKSTTATFTKAGAYTFQVVLTNAAGLTVTSTVAVTVNATVTAVSVTPSTATVNVGATKQFTASATDQFGTLLSPTPSITWSASAGGGSISTGGLYTAPASAGSATVTALMSGVTGTATVTIPAPPPSVLSLSLSPASVVGGSPSTGTVTLTGPAPAGGTTVTLISSNVNFATVPASVTVPVGATSATFTVSTFGVASATPVTISATAGGVTQTVALTVNPPAPAPLYLSNLTANPTAIIGGNSTTGTATLSGPAPVGGVTVSLRSNNSAVVVPTSVVIPAGANSQTFNINSSSVPASALVTISGRYGGWIQAATEALLPVSQSFNVQSLDATAGNACVVLSWAQMPEGSVRGYNVYRVVGNTQVLLTSAPQLAPFYADTGLTNGNTYQYRVSTVDINGVEAPFSSPVNAVPATSSPTMNWVAPPSSMVTGDLVLYGSVSSGTSAGTILSSCSKLIWTMLK